MIINPKRMPSTANKLNKLPLLPRPAPPHPALRSAAGFTTCGAPATEILSVYYEDTRLHAGFVNLGVRKALWPMVQKNDAGMRRFLLNHYADKPSRRGLNAAPPCTPAPALAVPSAPPQPGCPPQHPRRRRSPISKSSCKCRCLRHLWIAAHLATLPLTRQSRPRRT